MAAVIIRSFQSFGSSLLQPPQPSQPVTYAYFSRPVYSLWWTGLLLLHAGGAAYFTVVSVCYWHLPGTYLDASLTFSALGMRAQYHHTLARMHLAVALAHAALLGWMLGWSLRRHALVFGSGSQAPASSLEQPGAFASVRRVYNVVFGRRGCFGVDTPHFDLLLVLREVVETALLTVQAHRMSRFLPRVWLNRCYVALLVTNCWTTALMHHVYHDSPSRRRAFAILLDCLLDLATAIGVPLVLVLAYARDFDWTIHGFPPTRWAEDVWFVNARNEFQLVLVVSWGDLASRLVFSVGMISAMNSMKNIVRPASTRVEPSERAGTDRRSSNVVAGASAASPSLSSQSASITSASSSESRHPAPTAVAVAPAMPPAKKSVLLRTYSLLLAPTRLGPVRTRVTRVLSVLFFVWGLVIAALHIHAELNPRVSQCRMQVRPWLVAAPACSLVLVDCHRDGTAGELADMQAVWSQFEPHTVFRLVLKHCPRLEVPPAIRTFRSLHSVKLYNSTLARWGPDAALANALHPHVQSLFFVRVNFSDRTLPLGLQADDFPATLNDLEFCVTNLATLPDDIDRKWPRHSTVYLELGTGMTVVPDALLRVAPTYLSFAGTPIRELPAALFESDGVYYVNAGGTQIDRLPPKVTRLARSVTRVVVQDTAVAAFPGWVDKVLGNGAMVEAAHTPFCDEVALAMDARMAGPVVVNVPEEGAGDVWSRVMDLSATNLPFVQTAVLCQPTEPTVYTLREEDAYSGLHTEKMS